MHGWKLFLAAFFALVYAGIAGGLFYALVTYQPCGGSDYTGIALGLLGLLHSLASVYLVLLSTCARE